MLDLIENLKAKLRLQIGRERASAQLRAEPEAEARAPRVAGRVSQPYAIARPWLSPRQPTLEAPCIPMSTDYVAPAVADADTYHQRLNGSGVARTYSLEQADWLLRPALVRGSDLARVRPRAIACTVTGGGDIINERPTPVKRGAEPHLDFNPGRVAEIRMPTCRAPRPPAGDAFARIWLNSKARN